MTTFVINKLIMAMPEPIPTLFETYNLVRTIFTLLTIASYVLYGALIVWIVGKVVKLVAKMLFKRNKVSQISYLKLEERLKKINKLSKRGILFSILSGIILIIVLVWYLFRMVSGL
ncbi:MAG: hypothetical protein ATN35_04890 [Epulopiscium sp. Nele67-Bin004]|nr:MAG: hypothetical protein ATN35_04890 [Epulopiscium sp. Nele67-Bin004]